MVVEQARMSRIKLARVEGYQVILPIPYLEYNLFHLLIRGLELSDEDQHHLSGVVVSILGIHQWNKVPNSFEESSQTLVTKFKKYIVNANLAQ